MNDLSAIIDEFFKHPQEATEKIHFYTSYLDPV